MNDVTKNAFNFAQKCALDGVLPQGNVVYLAHYVQVLMNEYEQRIAELERLVRKPQPRIDAIMAAPMHDGKICRTAGCKDRATTVNAAGWHVCQVHALDLWGDDPTATLQTHHRNRAIMPAPVLNAEPDGDVIWA